MDEHEMRGGGVGGEGGANGESGATSGASGGGGGGGALASATTGQEADARLAAWRTRAAREAELEARARAGNDRRALLEYLRLRRTR